MKGYRGLYLITPDQETDPRELARQVAAAIRGGARLVQYRNKGENVARRAAQAAALLQVCRAAAIPLIINDDVELAVQLGADGVHLGRDDADPASVRARLGPDALIGVSCYASLALAQAAQYHGASYVAFGSVFPSPTKPRAVRAAPELLASASRTLRIPVVAIGGITPQNGGRLIAAGAHMLAVVTGVFAQPDLAAAARAYASLFPDGDPLDEPIP
ncbi:thiamine phosphate synthase [Thiocapsa imhoffii]|uniref:Thiamine-phosphate synthase n=1 Tax=Thiocapsa imhoffii TaxID=382777 RepID=A0A9X0WJ86_9GAMM|nr:thiamine phosphate synthase [Thiocapsa imhoffii]MBK1645553.1 thiamine phosphate synthase [Thiocapsa imhoffii]